MEVNDIYCFARLPAVLEDFWKVNQELTYIEPFSSFVKEKGSALIMSAIYLAYDPKSSAQNSGESVDVIKKDIAKNVLGDPKFSWGKYNKIIDSYRSKCRTRIEKELDDWYLQLQERSEYVNNLSWDENSREKEELLLKNDQHFQKYRSIVSALKEERVENLAHGNYTKSRLESRSE